MTKNQKISFASSVSLIWMFWLITIQDNIKAMIPPTENIYIMIGSILISGVLINLFVFKILPSKEKHQNRPKQKKDLSKTSKMVLDNALSDKELLMTNVDSLSGEDFENLMFLYFKDKGFKPERTPRTGDHGVDLVIIDPKDGFKIAVQCKRHKKNIGNEPIIKLNGGKKFYGCQGSLCITTSNYTEKAKEYAKECKVELWNGLHVQDKLSNWKKQKLKSIS
ncbi:restriction endonuclease [Cytobacillus sp.]|uniref:restriction endonuclease n=1 Tax=Cytobacillus sp. TaxID=2675269 RepID=UPI0028BE316A|nr:restriction endonuclease [Cytobacillus sp.]